MTHGQPCAHAQSDAPPCVATAAAARPCAASSCFRHFFGASFDFLSSLKLLLKSSFLSKPTSFSSSGWCCERSNEHQPLLLNSRLKLTTRMQSELVGAYHTLWYAS
uniref:Uncharacterized protein n=1 Tax=Opuntia streptacantha TaxID=393608 RepID=A0A7C9AFN0_OPUST